MRKCLTTRRSRGLRVGWFSVEGVKWGLGGLEGVVEGYGGGELVGESLEVGERMPLPVFCQLGSSRGQTPGYLVRPYQHNHRHQHRHH